MKDNVLTDRYGRQLTYLRLSVTDRCNFRCYYCMPEEGIDFASRKSLLSFDEMLRLANVFCSLGVDKIRITGGEPFVRTGIIPFLHRLKQIPGLNEITITSNGTLSNKHRSILKDLDITKINISLDSLDAKRFHQITRRDAFNEVYKGILALLDDGFDIKINCVVAENKNISDIIPFINLTKDHGLSIRFLEEMPFNGSDAFSNTGWDHRKIYSHISQNYDQIKELESSKSSTSKNYKIPGYKGSFGIIPSFSRTFCGTCNRIRLSATGELRTCLYGPPVSNLRDALRNGATTEEIKNLLIAAVANRERDGFSAQVLAKEDIHTSMSVLGG